MKIVNRLLAVFSLLSSVVSAQTLMDDVQLGGTANQVTSGGTLTALSGSTVTIASGATFNVPDAVFAIAKTSGLQPALDAKLDDSQASAFGLTLLDDADAGTARATLGVVIGTNVQAWNVNLESYATAADAAARRNLLGASAGIWPAATMPAFTGDASSSAGATALTLATVNASPGTTGGATQSHTLTVDAKGRVTAHTAQTVTPAWTSVTGKPTAVATSGLTDAVANSRTISTTAPLTGGGDLSGNRTLAISAATTSATGAVQLATSAEAITGTDTAKAITAVADRAALEAFVYPISFQRLALDQIVSDGATSNRAQIQIPGARSNLAGAASATWRGLVTVPSSNPSAGAYIISLNSTSTPESTHSLHVVINTTGQLIIVAKGAVTATDQREVRHSTWRTTYSGQTGVLEIYFVQGVTDPVVRWNDVNISAGFTPTAIGASPAWMDPALVSTYHLTGCNWPAGPAPLGCWILGALTDADRTYWRTTGKPPAWVVPGGTAQAFTPASSSFEDTTTASWGNSGEASRANYDHTADPDGVGAAYAGTRSLKVTTTATVTGYVKGADTPSSAAMLIPATAQSVMIEAYVFIPVASAGMTAHISLVNSASYTSVGTSTTTTTTGSWQRIALTGVIRGAAGVGATFRIGVGGADASARTFYVDSVKMTVAGALSLPGVQPIPVVDDWTSIGGNQARLVGMTPVTERRDFRIVGRTATSGNEQLLGGAVFDEVNRYRITGWTINNLGTSKTVSLGNISAGTAYASGITAGAGLNDTTLATRFNATTSLWVNSNGTDTLVHTIAGQRIGNN